MSGNSLYITRKYISCLVLLRVCVFPCVLPRILQFSVMGTSIMTLLLGYVETNAS
jgi:hypothetical protein